MPTKPGVPEGERFPMSNSLHLLVALTPHGYGHAAMTAPVINALRRRLPDLRLTLQTGVARDWLETRYEGPFDLIPGAPDFGLRMTSAVEVRVEESANDYRDLHAKLDDVVAHEAARLIGLGADLMLANIPYVSLLAARRAGLRSMALSCLNWADIYQAYCGDRPEADAIIAQMRDGYESAECFLRPAPAMPMSALSNTRSIGPIARRGVSRRDALRQQLGVEAESRVGLIAFGGMDAGLPYARWPRLAGWKWLVTGDPSGHPDLIAREDVDMAFFDILRSCDVVVGKPGYGTFTEAAVNGVPLLYLPRPDWPETPYLTGWLSDQGRCLPIEAAELFEADALEMQLQKLFSIPNKVLSDPSGSEEGAEAILSALTRKTRIRT